MFFFNFDSFKNTQLNPDLFKGEMPNDIKPETYYAYLDSVEQVDNEVYIQFDCVVKAIADDMQISMETLSDLPSIIIETKGASEEIKKLFNYGNLYQLESQWMVITTKFNKQGPNLNQNIYFNFQEIRSENQLSYNLESVRLFRDLDPVEKVKIETLIKATTIEESPEEEVSAFLKDAEQLLSNLSHVNVYNVGQGNCIGLVDSENLPLLYFDVGGGFGANADTYPMNFKLCTTLQPPVILSHWDQDHIQSAVFDTTLLNSKWLVPFQKNIKPTAMKIANELIKKKNLICWGQNFSRRIDLNNISIVKCTGNLNNKNHSGLALFVQQEDENLILLPGDAIYKKIPDISVENFTGIVASHHGAFGEIKGLPVANLPGMLVYSYGLHPDGSINSHKHPHPSARNAYYNRGWCDVRETTRGNIAMTTNLLNPQPPCGGGNCTLKVLQHF